MSLTLFRFRGGPYYGKEWHLPCTHPTTRDPETRGFGESKHESRRSTTVGSHHPEHRNAGLPRLAAREDRWARRGRAGAGGYVPSVLRGIEFSGPPGREFVVPGADWFGEDADCRGCGGDPVWGCA